jgi:molecular chaperone DnaK
MSEPVLGIDLGTSNSVLATVEDGRPLVIPSRNGGFLTPSMVAFNEGRFVVGKPARELLDWFPQRVATATKRYIGRRFTAELAAQEQAKLPYRLVGGASGEICVALEGRTLPLTQVSALVLGELFLDAQRYWGRPVRKVVITVPANFDDGQRHATKEAASIAGFELLRLVNEPTAAALAFGMARNFAGRALVFDLGGGTLDVTVLEVTQGVYDVKATGGHPQLGGEDFDARIMQWLLEQLPAKSRQAVEKDPISVRRLRTAAEDAKRMLSTADQASVEVAGLGDRRSGGEMVAVKATLERRVFEELVEPLWQQSLQVCDRVLSDAKLTERQVDAVVLIGGMTRVPRIRQLLAKHFGREPEQGVSPDEVVAVGAAIQASQLGVSGGDTLLLDVASHSLGVGFAGNRVRRLISKNAPIPARAEQCFLPASARQRAAVIPIFQGEGQFTTDNTRLGEVRLENLPGSVDRAEAPILVSFELGTDGTLSVSTTHPTSGERETLLILARSDLPPAELERLRNEQQELLDKRTPGDREAAFATFKGLLFECESMLSGPAGAAWQAGEREAVTRLLAIGRAALETNDWEKVAMLQRGLPRLVKAAQSASGSAAPGGASASSLAEATATAADRTGPS